MLTMFFLMLQVHLAISYHKNDIFAQLTTRPSQQVMWGDVRHASAVLPALQTVAAREIYLLPQESLASWMFPFLTPLAR